MASKSADPELVDVVPPRNELADQLIDVATAVQHGRSFRDGRFVRRQVELGRVARRSPDLEGLLDAIDDEIDSFAQSTQMLEATGRLT